MRGVLSSINLLRDSESLSLNDVLFERHWIVLAINERVRRGLAGIDVPSGSRPATVVGAAIAGVRNRKKNQPAKGTKVALSPNLVVTASAISL